MVARNLYKDALRSNCETLTIQKGIETNASHFGKGFPVTIFSVIDLLAILQKSLDRALFLYNFIREVRSSGVRGSIAIMHIRRFFKLHHNIVRFRFFPRIAKRSIV